MAHLIDKDALVAEIERRLAALKVEFDRSRRPQFTLIGKIGGLELCLSLINTLDVKEVDLDFLIHEEYADAPKTECDCLECATFTKSDFTRLAKHFFELGVKARQG